MGTILGESTPVSVAHETLQIACVDDFHFSSLKRNQMFLTDTVNTLLGDETSHRAGASADGGGSAAATNPPLTKRARRRRISPHIKDTSPKEHPLIETLYRDFGAERV